MQATITSGPIREIPEKIDVTFELTAAKLKQLLAVPRVLTDEIKIQPTKNGLYMSTVDLAHVAMMEIGAGKNFFDKLEVENEIEIGVSLDALWAFTQRPKVFPKDTKFRITSAIKKATKENEGDCPMLYIEYETREFQGMNVISQIDVAGRSDPKMPKLQLPAVAYGVPVSTFTKAFNVAHSRKYSVGDHMGLHAVIEGKKKARAFLTGEGDRKENGLFLKNYFFTPMVKKKTRRTPAVPRSTTMDNNLWKCDEASMKKWENKGEKWKSLFQIEYIKSFLLAAKEVGGDMDIYMNSDFPLRIDIGNDILGGKYLLAPRIENA